MGEVLNRAIIFLALILKFELFCGLSEAKASMPEIEDKIKQHVKVLAADLGERNFIQHQNLERAADYIRKEFSSYGYQPQEQVYYIENKPYRNIIATKEGGSKKAQIIIVCAHYDSVWGSPGADDNASGVAGLLELARLINKAHLNKTIKFIATTCEEPPFFTTKDMGSFRYAQDAKRRGENIEGALSLEMIGFFSETKKSQNYPLGLNFFYPDKGNFIAVASNLNSHSLLKRIVKEFKRESKFPIEYLIAPIFFMPAISFSDHWSFWKFGYKAVMITDTAFYRNPYYHSQNDTFEKLNYQSISSLMEGLYKVLLKLAE